ARTFHKVEAARTRLEATRTRRAGSRRARKGVAVKASAGKAGLKSSPRASRIVSRRPRAFLKAAVWTRAIEACADTGRARHYLELLADGGSGEVLSGFSAAQAHVLTALLGGSQALGNLVVAHP